MEIQRILFLSLAWTTLVVSAKAEISFNFQVRPLLSKHCVRCHGPDEEDRQAGFRIDRAEDAKADLGGYAGIVAGDARASEIMARIKSDDDAMRMPPSDAGDSLSSEEIQIIEQWINEGAKYEKHWSFDLPSKPPVPRLVDSPWCRNEIDHFIGAKHKEHGLVHSEPALPQELVRRVALGLTGLPPSSEQVARFVRDPSDATYEQIVDELLASPAYGEHWAAMWLDLARYADTAGYAEDRARTIWPWRDWVIDAFNANMSFDRFTLEQMAGDMLPNATQPQRLATAFHRNTLNNAEGGTNDEEFRVVAVKDRLNTTLNVWMGLTVRCAECHSHKYDPISHNEYYSMMAFFNQTEDHDNIEEDPRLKITHALARIHDGETSGKEKPPIEVPVMAELPTSHQRTTHVMLKGNYMSLGEEVSADTLSELHEFPVDMPRNRLGLAAWLTSPKNSLTARVTVNRFWARLFGIGIVETEEDFGTQGSLPTHPELLDWLATDFQENGWNIKALLKKLVMSATYRQASVVDSERLDRDPRNLYLSRGPRFRMSAEMVRDQALAVAGLLSSKMYGPPVFPPSPISEVVPAFQVARKWTTSEGENRYRRAIYTFLQRSRPHPLYETFDMASREVCSLRRFRTNTPLQALMTLNDPEFLEAAQKLARNMRAADETGLQQQICYGLEATLFRAPTADEITPLVELYESTLKYYEDVEGEASLLAGNERFGTKPLSETAQLASLTVVANVILNRDAFLNQ